MDKVTGEVETRENDRNRVRGLFRITCVLKATRKLHESVENCEQAIRNQIENNLKKKENQFKRIRMEQNHGEYASKKERHKAIPATYRRERGTDHTAASIRRIRYRL